MPPSNHVEQIVMTIDHRTLANIITRHFGITDDGSLRIVDVEVSTDELNQMESFLIQMERHPLVFGE